MAGAEKAAGAAATSPDRPVGDAILARKAEISSERRFQRTGALIAGEPAGGLRLHRQSTLQGIGRIRAPWQRPDPGPDDPQGAAATRAGQRRAESDPGPGTVGSEFEEQAQAFDQALAVGMQEPEIAGAAQTLGQHVLEQQPQEIGAGEGAGLPPAGLGVPVAEGHLVVLAGEDILLLQHAPIPVAAEIDQGLLPRADGLAVHDPADGMHTGSGSPAVVRASSSLARNTLARALWGNR